MKKFVALLMVLGLASVANANIIELRTDGVGSAGHLGTPGSPLDPGESILLEIVLNDNDYFGGTPGYDAYDGFMLSSLDIKLSASNGGILDQKGTGILTKLKNNTLFAPFSWTVADVPGSVINQMTGVASGDGISGANGPTRLIWNLKVTAPASPTGNIIIDMSQNLPGDYANFPVSLGGEWTPIPETAVGDLEVFVIPEPMTLALLGLGGLGLLRRRRA